MATVSSFSIPEGQVMSISDSSGTLIWTSGSDMKVFTLSALTKAAAPKSYSAAKSYDVIKYNNEYYMYAGEYDGSVVFFVNCKQAPNLINQYSSSYITVLRRLLLAYYETDGTLTNIEINTENGTNIEDSRTAVGTWLWTPRPDWSQTFKGTTGDDTYSINFTSNNTTYTSMEIDCVGFDLFYDGTNVAYGTQPSYPSGAQTVWSNTAYRTIKITGGTDATNSTLLAILRNNAFKYIG